MKTYFVTGFYGSGNTPCFVNVAENKDGSRWYCVDGGTMVNLTYNEINDGVNVEHLQDVDCFTVNSPITDTDALIEAIEA